jgi:hypothetical protein
MRLVACIILASFVSATPATEQAIDSLLSRAALPDAVVLEQVKTYLHARVPSLKVPKTREAWEQQSTTLRQRYLDEIILEGVPNTWTQGDVRVDYVEDIETGHGYRIRKLRYEALPGMWIPALLYEPDGDTRNLAAVLNVNGHYNEGKVLEEEQIRCINFAKRGLVTIHPEWLGMGELGGVDNDHGRSAYLDAVGIRGTSVFYLTLKRALDILEDHPRSEPSRLAMSGLSGGGWQTAVFSAVDERVAVIVPNAGHGAMGVRIDNGSDIGDLEQVPMDLMTVADYTHVTALFAPRPSLLIYNAQDNCCFQAARTLPAIYDPVVPVYELYGAESGFRFHINEDPGTHNYGEDNRRQFYKFVDEYLLPNADWNDEELPTEGEILPVEQTNVGLPEGNLSIVTTAIRIAKSIERPAIPAPESFSFAKWQQEQRDVLQEMLRYKPINLTGTKEDIFDEHGKRYTAYQFKSADWTFAATGVNTTTAQNSSLHIVMDDNGLPATKERLTALANEGNHAVAIAPLFQVGTSPRPGNDWQYSMLVNGTGERALALQAGQLATLCRWFRAAHGTKSITVHTRGTESGLIALTAAALNPDLIDATDITDMPTSLIDVMESRAKYTRSPSLFNFGFLRHFDFDTLRAMAAQG